jgi:hypothetical protein
MATPVPTSRVAAVTTTVKKRVIRILIKVAPTLPEISAKGL